MWAPERGASMSSTSKKKNPDCVVRGSTALAANWEDSISSSSFLLTAPFTFLCGIGNGRGVAGLVLALGLERRREISSGEIGVSLARPAVVNSTCMLAMEMGWSPLLV